MYPAVAPACDPPLAEVERVLCAPLRARESSCAVLNG